MGMGVGLFLVAVGAILAFAVHTTHTAGLDVHAVGLILLVVGILGMGLSLAFWSSWLGPGTIVRRSTPVRGAELVDDPDYAGAPGTVAGPGVGTRHRRRGRAGRSVTRETREEIETL